MLPLTDELIEGAINSISGFIVAKAADEFDLSITKTTELFINSRTNSLLSDKRTGFYWDSVPEMLDMFIRELSAELKI